MNLVVKKSVRIISLDPLHRTLELAAIAIQGIVIVNCAILYIATYINNSFTEEWTRPGKRNNWSSQSFAWLTLGLVSIFPHLRQHRRSGLNIHEIILLEKEKRTKGQDAWRADADLR